MTIGYVRHQPATGGISQKGAGGECHAEEDENYEEHGQSMAVVHPALEQGRGFVRGTRLFLGGGIKGP
jgi:hypothetical protein